MNSAKHSVGETVPIGSQTLASEEPHEPTPQLSSVALQPRGYLSPNPKSKPSSKSQSQTIMSTMDKMPLLPRSASTKDAFIQDFPSPNTKQDSSSTVVEGPSKIEQNSPSSDASPENPAPKRKCIGKWQLGATIGQGCSGKVKLAHHIETKENCVVKAVRRPKLANGATANSIQAQQSGGNPAALAKIYKRELYMIREACLGLMLNHPNIVKLHTAVLGEHHFYCFFEFVQGEDLVDFISRTGYIKEPLSRTIFRQVVSALYYAHKNHVVHRDLKLENIRYNAVTGAVKILDFGFATFYTSDRFLKTNCGSPCYAAPEIYDNKYYEGPLVDVWSLGVLRFLKKVCLFGMVTGSLPFDGEDFKTLAAKVRLGRLTFPKNLSPGVMNLLGGMLAVSPKKRFDLQLVARHPWVNYGYTTLPIDENEDHVPDINRDFVETIQSATICQAGCLLMEELQERIPSNTLAEAITSPDDDVNEILTDEDESNDEAEAEKFLSKMTVKEKPLLKRWWKRLWTTVSRAFIQNNTTDITATMRISLSDLEQNTVTSSTPYGALIAQQLNSQKGIERVRRLSAVNRVPESPNSAKHKRTSWLPAILRRK